MQFKLHVLELADRKRNLEERRLEVRRDANRDVAAVLVRRPSIR